MGCLFWSFLVFISTQLAMVKVVVAKATSTYTVVIAVIGCQAGVVVKILHSEVVRVVVGSCRQWSKWWLIDDGESSGHGRWGLLAMVGEVGCDHWWWWLPVVSLVAESKLWS